MPWLNLLIAIITNLPTIVATIKEIIAWLKKVPKSEADFAKHSLKDILHELQAAKKLGVEPNHRVLGERLQGILERLKKHSTQQ